MPGVGGGAAGVTGGGVNPIGVTGAVLAALVAALVGTVKYLISICGEMTASGAMTVGPATGSLALNSSGGPLVTAAGLPVLDGGALEVSGGWDGIGGAGRTMDAGRGGGMGASVCSAGGGGGTRKRKGMGPACGK